MQQADSEGNSKWQPVMLFLRGGGRLECVCGALAVVVIGNLDRENDDALKGVDYFCQSCYLSGQREVMDDE